MNPWHDFPVGEHPPERITAVIEIPRGSRNKYELDKTTGQFRLDRVLFSAVHYPGDYGFIPGTFAEDNDPLDVLVLVDEPSFPGVMIVVRPLGVIDMVDGDEADHKILAVHTRNPRFDQIHTIDQVFPHNLREIEHFFTIYKELGGRSFR